MNLESKTIQKIETNSLNDCFYITPKLQWINKTDYYILIIGFTSIFRYEWVNGESKVVKLNGEGIV